MDGDVFRRARFFAERHADMAAVVFFHKNAAFLTRKRQARENGDTVIALLSIHRDMVVAELFKVAAWELIVGTFRFL